MLPRVLRQGILALCAVALTGALLPDAALARGGLYAGAGLRGYGFGLHRPAYGALAVGFGLGYGYYGYPLDDSYDYPYGYGEYAEYGPWASRNYGAGYGGCYQARLRVWTSYGWRWRPAQVCN